MVRRRSGHHPSRRDSGRAYAQTHRDGNMSRKNMSRPESSIEPSDHGRFSRFQKMVFAVLLGTVLLAGLGYVVLGPATGREPRHRPINVPLDARWVGGADGGVYIRCRVDGARNVDHCEQWNDFSGALRE